MFTRNEYAFSPCGTMIKTAVGSSAIRSSSISSSFVRFATVSMLNGARRTDVEIRMPEVVFSGASLNVS